MQKPEKKSFLDNIEWRLKNSSSLPWTVVEQRFETTLGVLDLPIAIAGKDRFLVHEDHGLTYGLGCGGAKQFKVIAADCEMLAESKLMVAVLYRALQMAVGPTKSGLEKAQFLIEHARKEVLQNAGCLEDEELLIDLTRET